MKSIVTGGVGFVGSHLVHRLLEEGHEVVVIDDLSHCVPPQKSFYGNYAKQRGYRLVPVDVRSVRYCKEYFEGADIVFNLAATVAGVQWNKEHGLDMFAKNINTVISPVVAAQELGIERFMQMSSTCVVSPENQNKTPEDRAYEGHPHKANWGYGQAKRDGEYAALYWSTIPNVVVARCQNMYGPNDVYEEEKAHVVPALMNRIYHAPKNSKFEVYGSPDTIREFLYVKDSVDAIVHVTLNTSGKRAYNIGTGGATAITIRELVETLLDVMDRKDLTPYWNSDKGGGDDVRESDTTLLQSTGWQHKYDVRSGLEETYDWFERMGRLSV